MLTVVTTTWAQAPRKDTISLSPGKRLEILAADRYNFQKLDSVNQFVSLAGRVRVKQDRTLFDADSAVLNQKLNILEAFGHVHINDADSVHTYADYLKYLGKEKKAYLKNNVKLTDGKGTLTTQELEYDVALKIGTYLNGGKVVNGKTVLTSKEGYYYGETRDVYFKKNVVLNDPPDTKIVTDTLLYNTYTELTTFVSPTQITMGKRKIKTKDGYYDTKHKKAYFGKRSEIQEGDDKITSDVMAFNDSTGQGEFKGNVVYRGKDYDLIAGHLQTDRKKDAVLATVAPILLLTQNKDSVFIRADTLYSARMSDLLKTTDVFSVRDSVEGTLLKANPKDSAHDKFFEAYYHVRIFSDSMQAVGDSLFYSLQDSVFRLYKNPIVWSDDNQVTGDTIYLYVQNQKPEKIRVFENAMAISVAGQGYYNQVAGRTMNGFFEEGRMKFLTTKGSPAQSVYYAVDDYGQFVGVNQSTSDVIDMFFAEGKPQRVVFRNKLEGTMSPMRQVNHEQIKLRGFKWQNELRPKSKFEILSN